MAKVFKIRRTLPIENWRRITAIFWKSIEVVSLHGVLDDGGRALSRIIFWKSVRFKFTSKPGKNNLVSRVLQVAGKG